MMVSEYFVTSSYLLMWLLPTFIAVAMVMLVVMILLMKAGGARVRSKYFRRRVLPWLIFALVLLVVISMVTMLPYVLNAPYGYVLNGTTLTVRLYTTHLVVYTFNLTTAHVEVVNVLSLTRTSGVGLPNFGMGLMTINGVMTMPTIFYSPSGSVPYLYIIRQGNEAVAIYMPGLNLTGFIK